MRRATDRQSGHSSGQSAPVAVGGVGGSGTRVVAEVMRAFGFYLGSELNAASDNLWFTLLFRRPGWYKTHRVDLGKEVGKALSIFDRAMRGSGEFNDDDYRFVSVRSKKLPLYTITIYGHCSGRPVWSMRC